MKIFTSYFYNIRYLKPHQLPISTARYDPKWFHKNTDDQTVKFQAKTSKVICGLRLECLHPDITCVNLCHGSELCQKANRTHETCEFLKAYRRQIFSLDKTKILTIFQQIADRLSKQYKFKQEPEIILIVHEAPDNPCSERKILQEFFECEELIVDKTPKKQPRRCLISGGFKTDDY